MREVKQPAKLNIMRAFKEMLTKTSMDHITVREVCTQCHVNRQTFYYYFEDLMGVFRYIISEELAYEIDKNRSFDNWQDGFLATLHYLKTNSRMILHVYHSSYCFEANSFSIYFSNNLLESVILECAKKQGVTLKEGDFTFIVRFYRHIFNGLMFDWVNEGMKDEPEELLAKLMIMIHGTMPKSIEAFSKREAKD